jgi:hypothetical protein
MDIHVLYLRSQSNPPITPLYPAFPFSWHSGTRMSGVGILPRNAGVGLGAYIHTHEKRTSKKIHPRQEGLASVSVMAEGETDPLCVRVPCCVPPSRTGAYKNPSRSVT